MAAATWRVRGFDLERLLGTGGSSEVWRARVSSTGDLVALKRLSLSGSEQVRRAVREAATLRALDHPHLVRLHDLVLQRDAAVLVLDLADAGTLADLVTVRGRITPGEAITAIAPVAAALAHVHAGGIVHGDVSAANILFAHGGVPLLADLGVARLTGDPTDAESTPAYVDPLVARGGVPGPHSDVFMLGAVLLHALTGAPLWTAHTGDAALAQAATGALAHVEGRLAVAGLPSGIDAVIRRALELEPQRRGSAADFALDLRHSGDPVAVELAAGRTRVRDTGRAASIELDAPATAADVAVAGEPDDASPEAPAPADGVGEQHGVMRGGPVREPSDGPAGISPKLRAVPVPRTDHRSRTPVPSSPSETTPRVSTAARRGDPTIPRPETFPDLPVGTGTTGGPRSMPVATPATTPDTMTPGTMTPDNRTGPWTGARHAASPVRRPARSEGSSATDRLRAALRARRTDAEQAGPADPHGVPPVVVVPTIDERARPTFTRPTAGSAASARPDRDVVVGRAAPTRAVARARPRLPEARRRMPPRVLAAAGGVALVLVATLVTILVLHRTSTATQLAAGAERPVAARATMTVPSRPAASSTAAGTSAPPTTHRPGTAVSADEQRDWSTQLRRIDDVRARAYATRDSALLRHVYVPGSLRRADAASISRLVPAGCGLRGVHTDFADVRAHRDGGAVVVLTRASLPVTQVVCGGRVMRTEAPVGGTRLQITLVERAGSVLISAERTVG